MSYQAFASDLPKDRTITFRSAEEVEETFLQLGVNQETRQLGRGRFRSELAASSTEQADLFADRYSKACRMYLAPPPGMVGLLFFRSANGRFLASGANVANDRLFFLPRGVVSGLVTPDLAGSEAIGIPEARFYEMAEVLCPTCTRLDRMAVMEGNTKQLYALKRSVLNLLKQSEEHLDQEEVSNLLVASIAWMGASNGQSHPESLRVYLVKRRIAKQAEEYIEENHANVIHMEDICGMTGVGVRTLQRCFRVYFDVTITEFIMNVRLQKAYRELVAAHSSQKTVTQIALRNGFSHLGRFSIAFRRHYGISPNEVLTLRAGQKSPVSYCLAS
jgi:AraC-like DNA-binding protein